MKKHILMISAAVLQFLAVYDAKADTIASGNNCNEYDNNTICNWELSDKGVLIITGEGRFNHDPSPWDDYFRQVTAVVADGIELGGEFFDHGLTGVQTFIALNGGSFFGWHSATHNCGNTNITSCLISSGLFSCPLGKFRQENECVSACGESFRLNDGECDRIRYTPAEAARYLKDTDNEIIMTFKVNR
ncbi:MAG: hypothetical protein IKO06_02530 [Alphaproteobacteria bacterium]|nr:hypothetical protein [Alphaproteobacteria bacterium]